MSAIIRRTATRKPKMNPLTPAGLLRLLQAAEGKSGVIVLLSVNRRDGTFIAQVLCDWYEAFALICQTDAKGKVHLKCCDGANGSTVIDSPSGRWII